MNGDVEAEAKKFKLAQSLLKGKNKRVTTKNSRRTTQRRGWDYVVEVRVKVAGRGEVG